MIGECILNRSSGQAHVTGYVLPGRTLMVVVNNGRSGTASKLSVDLADWLPAISPIYEINQFNRHGDRVTSWSVNRPDFEVETPKLEAFEIVIYEIITRGK